jgi:hypothetical protein
MLTQMKGDNEKKYGVSIRPTPVYLFDYLSRSKGQQALASVRSARHAPPLTAARLQIASRDASS